MPVLSKAQAAVEISRLFIAIAQGVAACLCWGALHNRTMIFAALPDYSGNLFTVHLTCVWVEGIKAAINAVHSAGVLHNDLHLRNFVGNAPDNVKLVDFACSATSESSCQAMELEEKQSMETLPVQACLYKPSAVSITDRIYCCWTADVKSEMCVLQPPPILCHVCHLCARAVASLHHVSNLC